MTAITTPRQIGAAVRDQRRQLGMTQQQLADAAGVSRGFVARLDKGAATAIYPQKLIDVLGAVGMAISLVGAPSQAHGLERASPAMDAARELASVKEAPGASLSTGLSAAAQAMMESYRPSAALFAPHAAAASTE